MKIYKLSSCFCEIIFTHPNQNYAYKLINYGIREVLVKWALSNDEKLRESAFK